MIINKLYLYVTELAVSSTPYLLFLFSRCAILTESCHRFLDVTGPLQVGGLPQLPTTYQVQHQYFLGCISDLYIDHSFIDLNS